MYFINDATIIKLCVLNIFNLDFRFRPKRTEASTTHDRHKIEGDRLFVLVQLLVSLCIRSITEKK
jgi:hypothetical protein